MPFIKLNKRGQVRVGDIMNVKGFIKVDDLPLKMTYRLVPTFKNGFKKVV
jgi:hypothetical protein